MTEMGVRSGRVMVFLGPLKLGSGGFLWMGVCGINKVRSQTGCGAEMKPTVMHLYYHTF